MDFTNPETIQYLFILEGFDKKWNVTSSKIRRAFYTNLSPGRYRFLVKIHNDLGHCDNPAVIDIIVKPPYWMQKWFIVSVFLLVVILVLNRIIQNKKRQKILEKKVQKRTEELNKTNKQVKKQLKKIKEQNKEIANNHEEMLAQADQLKEQNQSLERAFQELDIYKNKLESLVEERTQELSIAKQKAEESDRLKTSFLSNLSHEVRTPLNAIMGFSTLVFDEELVEADRQRYKDLALDNCSELLKLIENIVEYSMLEAANIETNKTKVPISTLMAQFFQICEVQQRKNSNVNNEDRSIEFKLNNQIEDPDLTIYTDSRRVIQVMTQLIDNALKFTHEGFIELGCIYGADKNRIRFYVKDTGIGIDKENQILIFNSFTKLEFSKKDLYRGVGIGLSIALQLIRLLGGELHLDSEPGKGSTFSFELSLEP